MATERKRKNDDMLTTKTGGAYIPPAKLRMMQANITDKASMEYQRISWEALKKSIHGFTNKLNTSNIRIIIRSLFQENLVRGRGLLCKSLIQAQAASPTFTHVYAALIAVINSKFPNIGELLLKRLLIQFKRGFRRNDKMVCITSVTFIAHLINQKVAHEILALEILTLLIESGTDDSVEVAIAFLKECGQKLTEVSAKGISAIFEMLRHILHEGLLEKRVQYMIEVMFQIRKDGFKDQPAVISELDIVEEDDQFTHLLMLDDQTNGEDILNVFKFDEKFQENEDKYKTLSKEILGEDSDSSDESGEASDESEGEDEEANEEKPDSGVIIDNTETNLIALRRTIYLTIQSSLDYEECAHKLMRMQLKPGQEMELCNMFLDSCAEKRTYEKFYGLLAERFCKINKIYIAPFEQIFQDFYATAHRQAVDKLRTVGKFFAHLFFTDAIGWQCMGCIKLDEENTTSSGRIFIKILFQELAEHLGLLKLNEKLKDASLNLSTLFPRDTPQNSRFAINFFTSVGLGGLTDELREHLKQVKKLQAQEALIKQNLISSSSSSSSSDSDSSSDSSDSDSSSSSDSSDSSNSSSVKKNKKNKKKDESIMTKRDSKKDRETIERRQESRNDSNHRKDKKHGKNRDESSHKKDKKRDKNEDYASVKKNKKHDRHGTDSSDEKDKRRDKIEKENMRDHSSRRNKEKEQYHMSEKKNKDDSRKNGQESPDVEHRSRSKNSKNKKYRDGEKDYYKKEEEKEKSKIKRDKDRDLYEDDYETEERYSKNKRDKYYNWEEDDFYVKEERQSSRNKEKDRNFEEDYYYEKEERQSSRKKKKDHNWEEDDFYGKEERQSGKKKEKDLNLKEDYYYGKEEKQSSKKKEKDRSHYQDDSDRSRRRKSSSRRSG